VVKVIVVVASNGGPPEVPPVRIHRVPEQFRQMAGLSMTTFRTFVREFSPP
jgi:hypothetical protein